jgi:hypothetical protein
MHTCVSIVHKKTNSIVSVPASSRDQCEKFNYVLSALLAHAMLYVAVLLQGML